MTGSPQTEPSWLVEGGAVLVYDYSRASRHRIAKLTKRDVVLTDGQRFRRDRLSRSGPSTWSPTVYLRGPNDADALTALVECRAWQVLARLDRELRPLRKPGDRVDPAAALPLLRSAAAALERLIGGSDDR